MAETPDLPENLPSDRVSELHREGAIQLIDVREPYEHEAGRIAGARHLAFAMLSAGADSIDRNQPVVFYCRSGGRSSAATQAFRASGFDAHNMTGGMLAWVDSGLPIEPDGGTVADH